MQRTKYTEKKSIDGIEVTIECQEQMDYDGTWIHHSYKVTGPKKSFDFYGWPTEDDIRKRVLT